MKKFPRFIGVAYAFNTLPMVFYVYARLDRLS